MNRILLGSIFVALFFMLPFWLVFALALFAFFRVHFVWYEGVILGFLADIFSGPLVYFNTLYVPVFTVVSIALFAIALFIRKRMRFHV